MGWSLQNITNWSGDALEPAHTDPKMGQKIFEKFFTLSRTKTGRVKKIMVL
jgi:hypothetical protein